MQNLPQGWEVKTLGEIFLIERGGSPRPIKEYLTDDESGINWIKIGDTKDISKYIFTTTQKIKLEGKKYSRFVEVGDLILSNSMSFGKPYIMKTTGCIHDGWVVLRQSKKVIDEEFAYYILISNEIYAEFNRLATGSTVKNLNIDRIKQIQIPLPPLETQKAIVEKLENAFAHIDEAVRHLKAVQTNIPRLKSSLLHCAFSGKFTESQITAPISTLSFSQRKSNPSPLPLTKEMLPFFCTKGEPAHSPLLAKNRAGGTTAPAFSDFSHHEVGAESKKGYFANTQYDKGVKSQNGKGDTLPKGWEVKTLGEVCEIVTGSTPSKDNAEYYGDDFPFYKPTDLNNGYYVEAASDNVSPKGFEISRQLPSGSVLVTCIGATIGKTGLIRKRGICNQQINAILPSQKFISEFIYFYCISPKVQNFIKTNASSTTLPILNKANFSKLPIPLPPLATQNQIVQILESKFAHLEQVAQFVNESLENLQKLKSSLLNQAFKGELV